MYIRTYVCVYLYVCRLASVSRFNQGDAMHGVQKRSISSRVALKCCAAGGLCDAMLTQCIACHVSVPHGWAVGGFQQCECTVRVQPKRLARTLMVNGCHTLLSLWRSALQPKTPPTTEQRLVYIYIHIPVNVNAFYKWLSWQTTMLA